MEQISPFLQQIEAYLPSFLAAMAILVVGWIVALMLSALVRGILKKTKLDNHLANLMGRDSTLSLENQIGSMVFYIAMLFVLVAFFQALGLTLITEPLNSLLNTLFEFGPRLLAGGSLLFVAFILASVLKFVINKVMTTAKVDERLDAATEGAEGSQVSLSKTVSETVYWLVFLVFLPAILDAFSLTGMLEPINNLVNQVIGFIPNLLSAALVFGIGWFVARIIQRVVSNLLAASGADNLAEKFGLSNVFGTRKLSQVLGLVCYVLVIVPALISGLDALAIEAISKPAISMLEMVLETFPLILGALIIVFVAYTIGNVVATLVSHLLSNIGFDNILSKLGFPLGESSPKKASDIAGTVVKMGIILFGVVEAFGMLHFDALQLYVSEFTGLAGNVLLGMAIFAFGLFIANWVAQLIRQSQSLQANILASLSRFSILFLTGAMALRQMGLANDIINLAFGLLLGAVAIAAAIAFGVGGREVAGRELDAWVTRLKEKEKAGVS